VKINILALPFFSPYAIVASEWWNINQLHGRITHITTPVSESLFASFTTTRIPLGDTVIAKTGVFSEPINPTKPISNTCSFEDGGCDRCDGHVLFIVHRGRAK
jgi:hypothetical protein